VESSPEKRMGMSQRHFASRLKPERKRR